MGRSGELAELCGWLGQGWAGCGRVVLVGGPAGIGKTRLAEEAAAAAAAMGARVVWGRAVDDAGAPPWWPWQRVFRALPAVGAAVQAVLADTAGGQLRADEAAAARFRLTTDTVDALLAAAEPGGLLVVLDDLHWADEASLHLLRHLAGEVRRSRLVVLGAFRDKSAGAWAEVLPDLVRQPGVEVVRLGPWGEPEVAAYLSALSSAPVDPATAALVYARTGGNLLYVRALARLLGEARQTGGQNPETLAQLVADSPELHGLVAATLRGLDPFARQLLSGASVVGEEVDVAVLAAAVGAPAERVLAGLGPAVEAGVLASVPGEPAASRFVHALVRDVVYAELDPTSRAGWHRRVAEALEPTAAVGPERAGAVAAHRLAAAADAQELRAAAGWARRAANAAITGLAFDDATRFLTTAAGALQRAGASAEDQAELLVEQARATYRAGRFTDSLTQCGAAAEAAERAGRADLLAAAALVVRGVGDPAVAAVLTQLCARALAISAALPPAVRAGLAAQQACAHAEVGDLDRAEVESAEALVLAEAAGDPEVLLEALRARVSALHGPKHVAARLELATRAVDLAPAVASPLAGLWGRLWRIDAAYELGELQVVDEELTQLAAVAEATRLPLARWHLLRQQAGRAALAGVFTPARELSEQASRLAVQMQDRSAARISPVFTLCLAMVRGDPGELPADFLDELAKAPRRLAFRAMQARALLQLGHTDEAAAIYEQLRALPPNVARDGRSYSALYFLIDLAVAFTDTETAAAMYDVWRPFAMHCGPLGSGRVVCWGSTSRELGRLAALLGRHDDAIGHFQEALAMNTRLGARPLVAWTRLHLAEALHTRGRPADRAQAHQLARQAAAEARRLDMPGPHQRADRLLRDLAQAARATDPLTAREREVAGLVAAALTNRQIAQQLVVSERTVESHVRAVLAKLGLTSRTQLATWVLGPGQVPSPRPAPSHQS